jgi:hypothetical protein
MEQKSVRARTHMLKRSMHSSEHQREGACARAQNMPTHSSLGCSARGSQVAPSISARRSRGQVARARAKAGSEGDKDGGEDRGDEGGGGKVGGKGGGRDGNGTGSGGSARCGGEGRAAWMVAARAAAVRRVRLWRGPRWQG